MAEGSRAQTRQPGVLPAQTREAGLPLAVAGRERMLVWPRRLPLRRGSAKWAGGGQALRTTSPLSGPRGSRDGDWQPGTFSPAEPELCSTELPVHTQPCAGRAPGPTTDTPRGRAARKGSFSTDVQKGAQKTVLIPLLGGDLGEPLTARRPWTIGCRKRGAGGRRGPG